MLKMVDFSAQKMERHFGQIASEQDISMLLEVINRGDFDEFVELIDRFDLNQVYDHEEFPGPQLLSQFLLFRFLGFISIEGEEPFLNAVEFVEAVLEKKPDLTFCLDDNYFFGDFIKDRREALMEEIANFEIHQGKDRENLPDDILIQSYKRELSLLELIANYLAF